MWFSSLFPPCISISYAPFVDELAQYFLVLENIASLLQPAPPILLTVGKVNHLTLWGLSGFMILPSLSLRVQAKALNPNI